MHVFLFFSVADVVNMAMMSDKKHYTKAIPFSLTMLCFIGFALKFVLLNLVHFVFQGLNSAKLLVFGCFLFIFLFYFC